MDYEKEITTITHDLITSLGVTVIEIKRIDHKNIGVIRYAVSTSDAYVFTSTNAQGLSSVNILVKRILEQQTGKPHYELNHFMVDIGDFYARHIEQLRAKAVIVADRARSFRRDVPLEPMLPYERLIVHTVLSQERDIKTESMGIGKDRHVIVKFQGEIFS